jgi:hypothetical protein
MRWLVPVLALTLGLGGAQESEVEPAVEPKQPVTDNKQLPRNVIKPWAAAGFIEYAGVYTALKGEEPGIARMVLTPFIDLNGNEMISVCRISAPDLMAEPVYTVLGSLACDTKTGAVRGFSVNNRWKMVTYKDPNTGGAVFGIDADGLIYADWAHPPGTTKPGPPIKQAGEPPPSATPIPSSVPTPTPPTTMTGDPAAVEKQ